MISADCPVTDNHHRLTEIIKNKNTEKRKKQERTIN